MRSSVITNRMPALCATSLLMSILVFGSFALALEFNFDVEPGTSQQAIDGFIGCDRIFHICASAWIRRRA